MMSDCDRGINFRVKADGGRVESEFFLLNTIDAEHQRKYIEHVMSLIRCVESHANNKTAPKQRA